MIRRLQLVRLTFRRTLPLFLAPIVSAYLVLPLITAAGLASGNWEIALENLIYGEQALLPVGGLLWAFAYLQVWIGSDGEETMRACHRGKYVCAAELLMLNIGFTVMLLPALAAGTLFFGSLWTEYARLLIQVFFYIGLFYFTAILLRSVTMGGMLVLAYHLFCIFFCRNTEMRGYCLIRPDVLAGAAGFPYILLLLSGSVMYSIGAWLERRPDRG